MAVAPRFTVDVISEPDVSLAVGETQNLEFSPDTTGEAAVLTRRASFWPSQVLSGTQFVRFVVFTTPGFDALKIDDASVTLGASGPEGVPVFRRSNGDLWDTALDYDGDGRKDRGFYFHRDDIEARGFTVAEASSLELQGEHESAGTFRAGLKLSDGNGVDEKVVWSSTQPAIVSVDTTGLVRGQAVGEATVTAAVQDVRHTFRVSVKESNKTAPQLPVNPPAPPAPPALPAPGVGARGEVVYPNERVAFVAGPQLSAGSASNPWAWFDATAAERGLYWATKKKVDTYYDHALAQYINYYRTGDTRFRDAAREVADDWYVSMSKSKHGTPPRSAALGGMMLRALEMEGTPRGDSMWTWMADYLRGHDRSWLSRHYERGALWYGVRDGGYTMLYMAQLAKVHPKAAVRAEMREQARKAAVLYYARLQKEDGGWYWKSQEVKKGEESFSQPFQVGLLLEGLIAVHQQTGDPKVAQAILKGTEWLWKKAYVRGEENRCEWRAVRYFVWRDLENAPSTNCKAKYSVHEDRHRNSMVVHAFGYAYWLSGEVKYRTWGDEVFAATYGGDRGPGADGKTGLAFNRDKEYNQSYRSAGRYLAWRLGR